MKEENKKAEEKNACQIFRAKTNAKRKSNANGILLSIGWYGLIYYDWKSTKPTELSLVGFWSQPNYKLLNQSGTDPNFQNGFGLVSFVSQPKLAQP